jgi:vacuolar-type H+-ATPase subunit C/Vma6
MFKQFLTKSVLRLRGMPKEQAEAMAEAIASNPELAAQLKKIEENPEIKDLMEKIQKEIEEKTKNGMDQMMASAGVMMKYKNELAKHREVLEPLMMLMQR